MVLRPFVAHSIVHLSPAGPLPIIQTRKELWGKREKASYLQSRKTLIFKVILMKKKNNLFVLVWKDKYKLFDKALFLYLFSVRFSFC